MQLDLSQEQVDNSLSKNHALIYTLKLCKSITIIILL